LKENILVCVSNANNAEKLIERGSELSYLFGGRCYVLTIRKSNVNDLDFNWLEEKEQLNRLAKKYDCDLLIMECENKKIVDVIATVCHSHSIKQIVLGQPVRTKWEIFMNGSMINDLFSRFDGIDLHIVEIKKEQNSREKQFELGMKAHLIPKGEGYALQLGANVESAMNGLFFQEVATDFQNGVFKLISEQKIFIYRVVDGYVDQETATFIKK